MWQRSITFSLCFDIYLLQGPFPFLQGYKSPCWMNTDQQLRCLPFFYLIGAPKCGTTDLYSILSLHPHFRSYKKEPTWLNRARFERSKSFDYYTEHMAKPLTYTTNKSDFRLWDHNTVEKLGTEEEFQKKIVLGNTLYCHICHIYTYPTPIDAVGT